MIISLKFYALLVPVSGYLRSIVLFGVKSLTCGNTVVALSETLVPPPRPHWAACINAGGYLDLTIRGPCLRSTRFCSNQHGSAVAIARADARCIRAWRWLAGVKCRESRTHKRSRYLPSCSSVHGWLNEHRFLLMVTAPVAVSYPALHLLSRRGSWRTRPNLRLIGASSRLL